MPVHDVGYREWNRNKTPLWTRWFIIADAGFRIAFRSAWVKRILLFAWLPLLYFAGIFFGIEQLMLRMKTGTEDSQSQQIVAELDDDLLAPNAEQLERIDEIAQQVQQSQNVDEAELRELIREAVGDTAARQSQDPQQIARFLRNEFPFAVGPLADRLENAKDMDEGRNAIWSFLIMAFFKYPQAFMILFLVGFIAPGLISRDVRSNAFLLYFSRPISRLEYILGKMFIVVVFMCLITTLPALALYAIGVMVSPPDTNVIASTWDIPLRIMASTLVLIIPTSLMALMFSSLTQESRFASFAWFAAWALGHGAWFTILIAQAVQLNADPADNVVLESSMAQNWSVISIYNNLVSVQSWVFGFEEFQAVYPALLMLIGITLFSAVVLYRRVSAPIRV